MGKIEDILKKGLTKENVIAFALGAAEDRRKAAITAMEQDMGIRDLERERAKIDAEISAAVAGDKSFGNDTVRKAEIANRKDQHERFKKIQREIDDAAETRNRALIDAHYLDSVVNTCNELVSKVIAAQAGTK